MDDARLRGDMDLWGDRPEEACRWCGEPTSTRLAPFGRTPIALHAVCGGELIVVYRDWKAGLGIEKRDVGRLAGIARELEAG